MEEVFDDLICLDEELEFQDPSTSNCMENLKKSSEDTKKCSESLKEKHPAIAQNCSDENKQKISPESQHHPGKQLISRGNLPASADKKHAGDTNFLEVDSYEGDDPGNTQEGKENMQSEQLPKEIHPDGNDVSNENSEETDLDLTLCDEDNEEWPYLSGDVDEGAVRQAADNNTGAKHKAKVEKSKQQQSPKNTKDIERTSHSRRRHSEGNGASWYHRKISHRHDGIQKRSYRHSSSYGHWPDEYVRREKSHWPDEYVRREKSHWPDEYVRQEKSHWPDEYMRREKSHWPDEYVRQEKSHWPDEYMRREKSHWLNEYMRRERSRHARTPPRKYRNFRCEGPIKYRDRSWFEHRSDSDRMERVKFYWPISQRHRPGDKPRLLYSKKTYVPYSSAELRETKKHDEIADIIIKRSYLMPRRRRYWSGDTANRGRNPFVGSHFYDVRSSDAGREQVTDRNVRRRGSAMHSGTKPTMVCPEVTPGSVINADAGAAVTAWVKSVKGMMRRRVQSLPEISVPEEIRMKKPRWMLTTEDFSFLQGKTDVQCVELQKCQNIISPPGKNQIKIRIPDLSLTAWSSRKAMRSARFSSIFPAHLDITQPSPPAHHDDVSWLDFVED